KRLKKRTAERRFFIMLIIYFFK
ncbi:putative thiol peroxidase, partial [Haemophilus influenzae]